MTKDNLILNDMQVTQKIKRLAFQIYENNFEEKHVFFAGIAGCGYLLAQKLQKYFETISNISTTLLKVEIDKIKPVQQEVKLDINISILQNQVVVLVDDVLNTGRTMIYSLSPFLEIRLKKLQTAVLVDRNHKHFPISTDYVGYALSTMLFERVEVLATDKQGMEVYLS